MIRSLYVRFARNLWEVELMVGSKVILGVECTGLEESF